MVDEPEGRATCCDQLVDYIVVGQERRNPDEANGRVPRNQEVGLAMRQPIQHARHRVMPTEAGQ